VSGFQVVSEEEWEARVTALHSAVGLGGPLSSAITAAEEIYNWLTRNRRASSITISVGTITEQTGDKTVAVTLSDTQQVVLTAEAKDAAGLAVVEPQTWTVDNTAVVTLAVSEDTQTVTVAATKPPTLGEATVTLTDGVRTATTVITVVAGVPQTLAIVEGTPTEIPPGA
jgi:hypothetical protein